MKTLCQLALFRAVLRPVSALRPRARLVAALLCGIAGLSPAMAADYVYVSFVAPNNDIGAIESLSGDAKVTFSVGRISGNLSSNLTVNYVLNGTALPGLDYNPPAGSQFSGNQIVGSVDIPANATSATVEIGVNWDPIAEGRETVALTISENASYTILDGAGTLDGVILDADSYAPYVSIAVADPQGSESGDTATFQLTRTGSGTGSLTVLYSMSGVATNGSDYVFMDGIAVFPAGALTTNLTITPILDALVEAPETVIATMQPTPVSKTNIGNTPFDNYALGLPVSGTAAIIDPALPVVSPVVTVTAQTAVAEESGNGSLVFIFSRTGSTLDGLSVNYTLNGTATNGGDYLALNGSLVIPAGAATANLVVTPIKDNLVEGTEDVVVSVALNGSAYSVGSPASAVGQIVEVETVVSVKATDPTASETDVPPTDVGTFEVTREGDLSGPLTVNYTVTGTASSGADYSALSGSVVIPAGEASKEIFVVPVNDAVAEGSETVIVTLTTNAAYSIDAQFQQALVTILDNEPVISVSTPDQTASEAFTDPASVIITRSGSSAASLTVPLKIGGSATGGRDYRRLPSSVTFAPGQTTVILTIAPVNDSIHEPIESVNVGIGGKGKTAPTSYIVDPVQKKATVYILDNDGPLLF